MMYFLCELVIFSKTILHVCRVRGDAWADSVRGRIDFAQDLQQTTFIN